nr:penicillin acylase [uncultured bacterium]
MRRDARWIPYIEAKNDADGYFAQGYVTASDRLWQMDLMRRLARGETAEIFGSSVLEEDKRWRRFNFAKVAEENLTFLSPQLRGALEDYARGVNAYIASLTDETMPIEFKILQYKPREWKPSDTIVLGKILTDALSTTWRNDLLRASFANLPKDKYAELTMPSTPWDVILYGKDTTPAKAAVKQTIPVSNELLATAEKEEEVRRRGLEMVGLYAEDLAASNNWVISGKRTADGKPILANDPHLQPTAPGIWYLTHLTTPTMRVSGVTIPGVPGIALGHNENIAWGATNVGPDVQDLFVETFDAGGKYKTPSGWEAPVVRKETINVRPSPLNPQTQPTTLEVVETRHGPVITEEGGKKYALKWTALDPHNTEFEAFYRLNRAKDWQEFQAALKTYGGAAQNFVYADVKGNIGWYAASKIPIRRVGDGSTPYDGATNDGDWIGTIPFEALPHLYNPPSGLIVTANQRIVGTDYKYTQMSDNAASPWRARRIFDLLDPNKKVTMDAVRDVQYDVYSIPLALLSKAIVTAGAASAETLATLKAWDGRMSVDSRGSILTNEIRNCIGNNMADANAGVPAGILLQRVVDKAVAERSPLWLPSKYKSYDDLFKACDAAVRTSLADPRRLGPDPAGWIWGKNFISRFPHPLAVAPLIGAQFATPVVPIDGSGTTPNVGSNVSMRHIASPGNWDATRHVIPLGQSGDPKSKYFKDEFDAWRSGTPMVFPFTKPAVEAAAKETWVLTTR